MRQFLLAASIAVLSVGASLVPAQARMLSQAPVLEQVAVSSPVEEVRMGGRGKHRGWAKGNRGKHKGWSRGRGNPHRGWR